MASPSQPPHPALQPQLCLAPNSLRAFLRLSRAAVDDPISQHLSSLSHPSAVPFDPSSISSGRPANPMRSGLPPATCAGFVSHTLFPAWAARARVLEYCAGVAREETRPDQASSGAGLESSTSPETSRSQWGGTVSGGSLAIGAAVVGPEAMAAAEDTQRPSPGPDGQSWSTPRHPKVVNERLDPYSARDYSDESPGERLARVIREERAVEAIVRSRSWGVVKDRCGSAMDGWEEGMKRWESETDKANASGKAEQSTKQRVGSSWAGLWGSNDK